MDARFAALVSALSDLPANNIVLDGEVIVQVETRAADFRCPAGRTRLGPLGAHGLFAFDLLYLDGFDLRNAPLIERKRILAALLEDAKSDCFHTAHLEAEPALVFEQACAMGREGIVCKRRRALSLGGLGELAQDQMCEARRAAASERPP